MRRAQGPALQQGSGCIYSPSSPLLPTHLTLGWDLFWSRWLTWWGDTDLYPEESESRATGLVVWPSAMGAVLVCILTTLSKGELGKSWTDHPDVKHLLHCLIEVLSPPDDHNLLLLTRWWLFSFPAGLLAWGLQSDWVADIAEGLMGSLLHPLVEASTPTVTST